MTATIELSRIAPLSGVQAGARFARRAGVPLSGPMDDFSHAVANALVGNALDAAALEIGFGHSELVFSDATLIAFAGARAELRVNGLRVPAWRPLLVPSGSRLQIGPASAGRFLYLAIAGGIDAPTWLGSASAAVHGQGPAAARARDVLPFRATRVPGAFDGRVPSPGAPALIAPWWADAESLIDVFGEAPLRLMPGTHHGLLDERHALFGRAFRIARDANRMAALLDGPALAAKPHAPLISEPVVPGTLQLLPSGQIVVLLRECGVSGGYPRLAHLCSIDFARFAQRPPGSEVRFEPISVDAAQWLWRWRRQRIARLAIAARGRLGW
jgi:antagonist of KipI